ncbi:MAG TPA: GNA1162 family protein, partial [Nitrospiraceae bacterium]
MHARTVRRLLALWLLCWLSTACSALDAMYRHVPPDPGNPIKTVAVLPLINNTNDVTAPQYIRNELIARLQALQYAVQPALQTDQILRDQLGITLGRQLDMATVQQLHESLGTDGVIFGVLDNFSTKAFGLLTEKRARLRLSLVNASDGSPMWTNGAGVIGRIRVVGGTAGKVALGFEVTSRLEAARESAEQAQQIAGGQTVGKLPGGLDRVPAPWFTIPTVEVGQEPTGAGKAKQEGGNVGAGLAAGLGEQLIERAVGKPLYQETRLMLNL